MSIHLSMPSDLIGVIQQDAMNADDLYTPRYTRFSGAQKEGYCDLCSPGKWLKMKNSTFWYHKQFFHGISHKTCTWFDSPSETRMNKDVPEGKCHKCVEWIPLLKQKRKNGNINWFHHAASCHFREEKRKRYDTEDLLNELKRRKDELSDEEFDLASLQPHSQPPLHPSAPTNLKSPTSATTGSSISPEPLPAKRPTALPVLRPDLVRPRPIDVASNRHYSNHVSPNQISPNSLQNLSPQSRANHENLLQLQLHHMQQIQQIQMMLYSPNSGSTNNSQISPQQMSQISPQQYATLDQQQRPLVAQSRISPPNGYQQRPALPLKPILPGVANLPPLHAHKDKEQALKKIDGQFD